MTNYLSPQSQNVGSALGLLEPHISRPGCRTVARDVAHLERPNGYGIGAFGIEAFSETSIVGRMGPEPPRMGSRAPRDLRPSAVVACICAGTVRAIEMAGPRTT